MLRYGPVITPISVADGGAWCAAASAGGGVGSSGGAGGVVGETGETGETGSLGAYSLASMPQHGRLDFLRIVHVGNLNEDIFEADHAHTVLDDS
jgi:hypothetical protein